MPVITTEESKVHFMRGLIKLLWYCTVLIEFLDTDTNVNMKNVNIKSFT